MTEPRALEAVISEQIVRAMKAHDPERTGTLRLIKAALKNKAIEKRGPLNPAEEQQTLATMIKQRRDSIEQFTKGNRPELAAKEASEIAIIEHYMPKSASEDEIVKLVTLTIDDLAVKLNHKAKHAMGCGMLGPEVEGEIADSGFHCGASCLLVRQRGAV